MLSPYDSFAWFYDRYWAAPFQEWQTTALDRLLLHGLKPRARILDLCCGTGGLVKQLAGRGYAAAGIDSSAEMLRLARQNAPQAAFVYADIARFTVMEQVDAVVCTFDSINHVLDAENLVLACCNARSALVPGGRFVFDVNTGAAYGELWGRSACQVAPDHAFILRGGFDPAARIGTTAITMFRLLDTWQRWDVEILQRPWEIAEIEPLLASAGFSDIGIYRAFEDLGMTGHYGEGRVYFLAWKR